MSDESNFFYISIHDNDIDLMSATQWKKTAVHTPQHNTNAEYSYHGKMLKEMTLERSVNTSFECSQPLFFSSLVTVNNLGLRRFIALHSKCSRRIRVLWPSYWSNWEDVQQPKRNSWEPHRMHGIRKASGPLLAYGRQFKLFSGAWW